MHGKIESVNNTRDGKLIKSFHEFLVNVLVIKHESLITEVKRFSHVTRLVVTTQKEDIIRSL